MAESTAQPRLVYLTAGAGGMYCGSCLHDNALVKSLCSDGWDAQLVPLYTPIRTDEDDVSIDQVFFGGINVFLQQKLSLFRWLPRWMDRWLDQPWFLRRVTSKAVETDAAVMGDLAISMLRGMDGRQRKEVRRLVDWMTATRCPDLVLITNILVSGFVPELKRRCAAPILVTLQGDDVFLERLPPADRQACLDLIRRNAESIDGLIVHSRAFAEQMQSYLGLPAEKFHVTPLGIDVADFQSAPTTSRRDDAEIRLGYLARLAPEKGLHHLVEAFIRLKQSGRHPQLKLHVAGWLGATDSAYAAAQWQRLNDAGLAAEWKYFGEVDRRSKLDFLGNLDVFSVPTQQREPKGLFLLEAMAAGLPVVQPAHGAFPEMIEPSGGGVLYPPENIDALVTALEGLIQNRELRRQLGLAGRRHVLEHRNSPSMARSTSAVLRRFLSSDGRR